MPLNPIAGMWPLLAGMGVLMLGAGLQGTLLGVRATLAGFPTPVIGMIMSCYYVGYVAGTTVTPHLLRRVGHVRVFAASAAVASTAILVQAIFVHPFPWAVMRLVTGICFAGIYVVAESWLNHRASCENRGRLLAAYMLILYVGLGAAQFLLTLSNPATPAPFMLVSALISLAMVPIVISAQQAPEPALPRKVRYRDLYRDSPLGVVAVAVSGMISSIIFAMGPVYAKLEGFGTGGVAVFMAVSILAAVVTQYPVGRLSDRMDRRTVVAGACTVATIVAVCIVTFHSMRHATFLVLTALFSGSALTLYSLAVSHINDKLETAQMVSASSALLMLNGTAAAVGPLLAGNLIAAFGPPAYFATLAALTGVLAVFDLWRKSRRGPVPATNKGPFIAAQPQGTAAELVGYAALEPSGGRREPERTSNSPGSGNAPP